MIAAIYARKSTEQAGVADEQRSVARQVEHARTYAARKGWSVDDASLFVDDGISGAEFAARPGFLRLMNALKPRPPFQVLVMSEESRLGREAIETAYALKQIIKAGVRVFFYLEDRERTLDSPTDKIMLSLTAFADELEREKARQRTYDAMQRKARAGHVTGGRCFGYQNAVVAGADGKRSHVQRAVEPGEAEIIRRIFGLCADGYGVRSIAKLLNDQGAPAPRAQRGRSQSWAPSSVREALYRDLYRGEIVWNQTRKRDTWGQHHQTARPSDEWIRVPAPELRIVSDDLWSAAHARLEASRRLYLNATNGRAFGRPAVGTPSPYLLTNLAECGCCRGTLKVRTRAHGRTRAKFYGCAAYHDRGRAVCSNARDIPMADANLVLLEALLDDVLDPDIISDAIEAALVLVQGDGPAPHLHLLEQDITKVQRERARLVSAIATGGDLPGLLAALQERERRLAALESDRTSIVAQRRSHAVDGARTRAGLTELADEWRHVLSDDPENARPVVLQLLDGRVAYEPIGPGRWRMTGRGTLAGLFVRDFPLAVASPAGVEPAFRP